MSLDDFNIRQAYSALDNLVEELEQIKKELKDQRELECGKLMPIADYPIGGIEPNIKNSESPEHARQEMITFYERCLAIKKKNEEAIKNNVTMYESLRKLIQTIGISSSYKTLVKGRTVTRDWTEGLRAAIPMKDDWEDVQHIYGRKMKEISEWEKEIADKEKRKQQEEKDMEWIKQVAILADKYGLPISASAYDVLEVILSRSKYLALGDALLRNRNDWSDGPDIVKSELGRFSIENNTDKAIHDALSECIENWNGDGRIFRDCAYNYNRLFGMVDKSLMDDYKMITANIY